MSNSKPKTELYPFIIAGNDDHQWINISILNGDNEIIAQNTGSIDLELPKGLYTILTEVNGKTKYKVVQHNQKTTYTDINPFPSSIVRSAENIVNIIDLNNQAKQYNQSNIVAGILLYLYIAKSPRETAPLNTLEQLRNFRLYNNKNECILKFEELNWNTNQDVGSIAIHHPLAAGNYYLSFKDDYKWAIPIAIFKGIQTQVILAVNTTILFETLRIFLHRKEVENILPKSHYSYRIALHKLLNKDYNLSEEVIKDLAHGKWTNPMYGIIVAYIYLKSKSTKYDRLFKAVVQNLNEKILDTTFSADLQVINLLTTLHYESKENAAQQLSTAPYFKTPPMLSVGMETIIEWSYNYPNLLEKNGLLDLIADRLYHNSVWTSFKPPKSSLYQIGIRYNILQESNAIFAYPNKLSYSKLEADDFMGTALPAIIDSLRDTKNTLNISLTALAQQLKLPLYTLERRIEELYDFFHADNQNSNTLKELYNEWSAQDIDTHSLSEIIYQLYSLITPQLQTQKIALPTALEGLRIQEELESFKIKLPALSESQQHFASNNTDRLNITIDRTPIALNLLDYYNRIDREIPEDFTALETEDIWLIIHTIGILDNEALSNKILDFGYKASFEKTCTVMDSLPKTPFIKESKLAANLLLNGAFWATPELELNNNIDSLGKDISLYTSPQTGFIGKLEFNVLTPLITSIGEGHHSAEWNFQKAENKPLLGMQKIAHTLLTPKGLKAIRFNASWYATVQHTESLKKRTPTTELSIPINCQIIR